MNKLDITNVELQMSTHHALEQIGFNSHHLEAKDMIMIEVARISDLNYKMVGWYISLIFKFHIGFNQNIILIKN